MTNKNEKSIQPDTTEKTIYSRLDYSWYMMGAFLDMLRSMGNVARDKEFNRLLGELRDYVDKQFFVQCEGEINDIFVVAEQIIKYE